MNFDILNTSMNKEAMVAILNCNQVSSVFGLSLTPSQAVELVESRSKALKESGRLEFGGGIIEKLIFEFCDSKYLEQSEYSEIMNQLVDLFYQFKNATNDLLSDDEISHFMREAFDRSEGSIDLLEGKELDNLLESLKGGDYGRH